MKEKLDKTDENWSKLKIESWTKLKDWTNNNIRRRTWKCFLNFWTNKVVLVQCVL